MSWRTKRSAGLVIAVLNGQTGEGQEHVREALRQAAVGIIGPLFEAAQARFERFDHPESGHYAWLAAMFFNVSGLLQEGIGATRSYDVEGTVLIEGRPPEDAIGTVELLRTKIGVLVRAHLTLVEPEACSRCLKPLQETVAIEFEEEFQATSDPRSGEQLDEDRDPDAFVIDERHMLDLTEAVRQYREVSLSMQPLCRPECRGLCPLCGRDLNLGECRCERGLIDQRWAGLAPLRASVLKGKE